MDNSFIKYTFVLLIIRKHIKKFMTRDQAYALYTVLLEAQSNKLEKELLKKYVLLKLDLHKIKVEVDEARERISEDTKIEDEKAWNKRFMEVFQEWLEKPSNVKAGIFSIEELVEFIQANKLNGGQEDFVMLHLLKKDDDIEEVVE